MSGLLTTQMSFLLWATSDTLPTPLNLARWRIQVNPKCSLCGNPALPQPKFLTVVNSHWSRVDSSGDMMASWPVYMGSPPCSNYLFLDLPGKLACENPPTTIPNDLCYTTLRPEIVLLMDSQMCVAELTIPTNALANMVAVKKQKQQN